MKGETRNPKNTVLTMKVFFLTLHYNSAFIQTDHPLLVFTEVSVTRRHCAVNTNTTVKNVGVSRRRIRGEGQQ